MRLTACLVAALLAATTAAPAAAQPAPLRQVEAPSGTYVLDLGHSSLTFRVKHLGLSNYTMRFARFDATVDYDAADPTRSKLSVTIDPRSVRTDYPFPERENFDAKLANDPEYLNAGAHLEIRFVSRSITRTGPNTGRITGDLTLRGVTRPVTLEATFNGAVEHPFRRVPVFGVSATGTFRRSDFGMTVLIPMIGDEVQMTIETEFGPKS
ncbi:MAG: YceI family protein [Sphingomonadaceae bacterium]